MDLVEAFFILSPYDFVCTVQYNESSKTQRDLKFSCLTRLIDLLKENWSVGGWESNVIKIKNIRTNAFIFLVLGNIKVKH